MNRTVEKFDVAVVGGGMIGATLACILARSGVRTALLEGRAPLREWSKDSVDLRVSALTMTSRTILDTLGAWKEIEEHGAGPYRHMQVWDPQGGGELYFDGADMGQDVLGYIVENRVSVAALWNLLDDLPEATAICSAKVTGIRSHGGESKLILDNKRSVIAQLVVAADGADSALRSMVGIEVRAWSQGRTALVAAVESELSHRETAYQRFLKEGPLAFLPLANGMCSIVWTSSSDTTRRYLELSEEAFIDELQAASGGILGKLALASKRASFPLCFQIARNYFRDGVVLVGDAAHAVHPLAGQGANMGILDAAGLAELLITARESKGSISGVNMLRRYERWRKDDNLKMLAGMDFINRVFSDLPPPFGQVRSLGMNLINRSDPIKNFFNRYAMGLRPDLPSLASGKACW